MEVYGGRCWKQASEASLGVGGGLVVAERQGGPPVQRAWQSVHRLKCASAVSLSLPRAVNDSAS